MTRRQSFNIANVSAWPTALYSQRKMVPCPLDVCPQEGGAKKKKTEYPLDARPQAGRVYVTKNRNQPMTLRGGIIQKTTRATAPVKTRKKNLYYYNYYIIITITAFIGRVSRTYICQRTMTTNIRKNLYLTLMYELNSPPPQKKPRFTSSKYLP